MAQIDADILRRLLVAKHLLAASRDQLTPNSDAASVARMVLVGHDAAELAIAAIASHLKVAGLTERISLPDYASKIESQTKTTLSGGDYLKKLNSVRVGFKHHGVLPDAGTWYRVVDNVWARVDEWCRAYLDVALDDIDLEQLLADTDVKRWYEAAKAHYGAHRYRDALEAIGRALYEQLRGFPGVIWPTVGRKNTEHALMLAAFGVRSSDFLALQDFLPSVAFSWTIGEDVTLRWNPRENGHEGNWTEANVRFCLETFLDLALKIQHAPPVPRALPFTFVFDDVITPSGETADLFKYEYGEWLKTALLGGPGIATGRTVVKTLKRGERFRCRLTTATPMDKPPTVGRGLSALTLGPEPTIETAEVLRVLPPDNFQAKALDVADDMYVERKAVLISVAPRDDDLVRRTCPHLFPTVEPSV